MCSQPPVWLRSAQTGTNRRAEALIDPVRQHPIRASAARQISRSVC